MIAKRFLQSLHSSRFILTLIVGVLLMLLLMSIKRQSWVAADQQPTTRGPAQVVRFTVYDAGIFPHDARVRPGSVVIRAEDLSGTANAFIVRNADHQVIGQIIRGESQSRGSARFNLTTGVYQICDAGQLTKCATLNVEL